MNTKKTVLVAAMAVAMGEAFVPNTASAVVVPDGGYQIVINTTPTFTTYYGGVGFKFGKDGAWNSSFTFGGSPPNPSFSQLCQDNGNHVLTPSGLRGSSLDGDGYCGTIGIAVNGNTFTVNSFQVDAILKTAGGTFVQYGPPDAMSGTINQATGEMTFTPTGRLAALSRFFSSTRCSA